MNKSQDMLLEMLCAAMTSGLPQKGATYHLPESLALEYGRICYNQAIKDLKNVVKAMGCDEDFADELNRYIIDQVVYPKRKVP